MERGDLLIGMMRLVVWHDDGVSCSANHESVGRLRERPLGTAFRGEGGEKGEAGEAGEAGEGGEAGDGRREREWRIRARVCEQGAVRAV